MNIARRSTSGRRRHPPRAAGSAVDPGPKWWAGRVRCAKLNYKVVYSGSEATTITAFQNASKNKTPLIGYFYDPQWLLNTVPLKKVNLPAYTTGCDADPKTVACDYPPYTLNKIVATKFVTSGGDAWTLVKNFTWTNADQNLVADDIANHNMAPADAAKKWLDAHESTWKAWMPAS